MKIYTYFQIVYLNKLFKIKVKIDFFSNFSRPEIAKPVQVKRPETLVDKKTNGVKEEKKKSKSKNKESVEKKSKRKKSEKDLLVPNEPAPIVGAEYNELVSPENETNNKKEQSDDFEFWLKNDKVEDTKTEVTITEEKHGEVKKTKKSKKDKETDSKKKKSKKSKTIQLESHNETNDNQQNVVFKHIASNKQLNIVIFVKN